MDPNTAHYLIQCFHEGMIAVDYDTEVINSLSCYFTAITCAIFCFLPAVMEHHIDLSPFGGEISSVPLLNALLSSRYHTCVVLCIGASLPVLFDLTIDLFIIYTTKHDTARSAVWLMFLSLIIPNIITYLYVIPGEHIEIFQCIIKSRLLLLLAANMIIVHGYGSSIWRLQYTFIILASYGIGQILNSFTPYQSNNQRAIFETSRLVAFIITYATIIILTLFWIRYIFKRFMKSENVSHDDIYCSFNVISLVIMLSLNSGVTDMNSDTSFLEKQMYMLTGFTVVLVMLNS
eukprot:gene11715-24561_t